MHEFRNREVIVHSHDDVSIGEGGYLLSRIVYYLLGIVETILAMRVILKLLGANPGSSFVVFIYNLSHPFIAPFTGIFSRVVTRGIETQAVLEPAALIAMLVYALLAWGIIRLVYTLSHSLHRSHHPNIP